MADAAARQLQYEYKAVSVFKLFFYTIIKSAATCGKRLQKK